MQLDAGDSLHALLQPSISWPHRMGNDTKVRNQDPCLNEVNRARFHGL